MTMPGEGGEGAGGEGGEGAGAGGEGGGDATVLWTEGLEETALGYVENKGWKGAGDMLKSYQSLEGMQGVPPEQLLRLPSPDDADGWTEAFGRLGRPEDAAGYEFPDFEVAEGAPDIADDFRSAAFEQGLSQKHARGVVDWFTTRMDAVREEQTEAAQLQSAADMTSLKAEWGQAYDENIQAGKLFAQRFGFLENGVLDKLENAMGTAGMLKFAAQIGRGLGEHTAPDDESASGAFGATPGSAKDKILQLRGDVEFMKRYTEGDKHALKIMTELNQQAAPGPR